MLANVIWLYYWPFSLFQRAFPIVAVLVVAVEAGILVAARVPWRRSLVGSFLANAASNLLGIFLVSLFRGSILPDHLF